MIFMYVRCKGMYRWYLRLYVLESVPHVHEAVPRLLDIPGVSVVAWRRQTYLLDSLLPHPDRPIFPTRRPRHDEWQTHHRANMCVALRKHQGRCEGSPNHRSLHRDRTIYVANCPIIFLLFFHRGQRIIRHAASRSATRVRASLTAGYY